ncbi:FecCD family ABC transporter permease [Microbacterium sp. NPDC058342]|uniref:FecCD family ABC transporter permease n=1 Tax=Microbacterium sp. NPDC058342 TaxID=3346454 RepID=UPI003666C087
MTVAAFRRRRESWALIAATPLVLAALLASLALGGEILGPDRVVGGLLGGEDAFVVQTLRLPRAAAGIAVGAALALAGAIAQTVMRNPLASPDIVGVTGGASVGAVAVITFAGSAGGVSGSAAMIGVPLAAVAGGAAATLLVSLIARTTERVVLVGVGVTAMCQSAVTWLLVQGDVNDAGRAATWLTGSLNGRNWADVVPVLAVLALCLLALTALVRPLSMIALGDDVAEALGVRVNRVRWISLALTAVLAGVATAAAGPVAFVGLCAPAIAQRLTGAGRPPLLLSVAVGAILVGAGDLVGRNLFAWFGAGPVQLPVGIVTGAVGAVYLIFLIRRRARS